MERALLEKTLRDSLHEIAPKLDMGTLDNSVSLRERKIDSVTLVELLAVTMKKTKIKVPRNQIAQLDTLEHFIRLFETHATPVG